MEHLTASERPQRIPQEHLVGSVRLIGDFMVLPYDDVPNSDTTTLPPGTETHHPYGIERDTPSYNQGAFGTTALAGQALDTAQRFRSEAASLSEAADTLEEIKGS